MYSVLESVTKSDTEVWIILHLFKDTIVQRIADLVLLMDMI